MNYINFEIECKKLGIVCFKCLKMHRLDKTLVGDSVMALLKHKIHWNYAEFFRLYAIWLAAICLNVSPIIIDIFKLWLDGYIESGVISYFLVNSDILYINFSTAFLIVVEVALGKKKARATKAISGFLIGASLVTFGMYLFARLDPNWELKIPIDTRKAINIITFALIFALGTIRFVLSTLEEKTERRSR